MLLAAAAFLSLAAEAQPGQWRTYPYPGGREMRFQPPEIRESDYPTAALRRQAEGRTLLRLTVSPAGQLLDCAIQQTSGSADLDAKACEIYRARARFELRNFTENHVFRAPITWRLAAAPSPAAAPAQVAAAGPATPPAADAPVSIGRSRQQLHAVALGSEFRVTADMVTLIDDDGDDPRYRAVLSLRGSSGDSFQISWSGSEPMDVDNDEYEAVDSFNFTLLGVPERGFYLIQPARARPDGTFHPFSPYTLRVRRRN